jgi:RNA polymerase subunit RPABC4/transcription elongation factor Spt4
MFGVVSRNFVAARHPFRKRVSGCIQSTSFFPPEPFLRFSQRTCPIHYSRSKTHVWGGFAQFRCRTSAIPKTGVGVHTKHEFSPPEPFLRFSQRTYPIHYFRSKPHVWGGFTQFRCRTSPIPKTGVGVHTKHEFLPPEPILCFSQRTCPIHYFRSKTHVWGGFALYRCRTSPIQKTGVGVHTKHEFFSTGTISLFFATNMPNPLLKVQNSCLGWFRVISLSHVTHSENGCRVHTKHEFSPPEPFLRFSQRTYPIHYFRSKPHVWGGFTQFRCRTSPIPKMGVGVHTKHEFLPPEQILCFSQRTCPIHYFRSKTHVWGGFALYRCRTSPIPKTCVGVHTKHEFLPPEPFLRFSQRTCPIHYFRPKTHVWGGFAQLLCRTSRIPKTGGFPIHFVAKNEEMVPVEKKLVLGMHPDTRFWNG